MRRAGILGGIACAMYGALLAHAQAPGPRPSTAPPLVPVRLNVDGNFRIAPPYIADPAFTTKPDVPKGRVIRFTMNSAESRIFPTGPAGRTGGAGGRPGGQGQPGAPAISASTDPPQHQTFERQVAVYVPAGYVASTPAPFIVVQDERWYIPEDAPNGSDGKPRTDLPFLPVMLDNLIYDKRIPPIVRCPPGPGASSTATIGGIRLS